MQFRTKKTGKKISLTYLGEVDNPSQSVATTEKKVAEEPQAGPSNEPFSSHDAAADAIAGSAESAQMEVDVEEPLEVVPEPLPIASPVLWTFPKQKPVDALASLTRPARKANISVAVKKSRAARVSAVSVSNEFKEKGQSTVKGADGACIYWSSTFDSPVSCLQANVHWAVVVCENRLLHSFATQSGTKLFTLLLEAHASAAFLNEDALMVYCVDGTLLTWNLRQEKRIVKANLECILKEPDTSIVRHSLSAKGVPVLLTNKSKAYVYSPDLAAWISVNCASDSLVSVARPLHMLSALVPSGVLHTAFGGTLKPANQTKNPAMSSASRSLEEQSLESLLMVTRTLESPVEYRFLLAMYMQKLVAHHNHTKFQEFVDHVRRSDEICGIPTAELLHDLQPLIAEADRTRNKVIADRQSPALAFIK